MKFLTTFTLATVLALVLIGSTEAKLRGLRSMEDPDPDDVRTGDAGDDAVPDVPTPQPNDACDDVGANEQTCAGREGCYWYPHVFFKDGTGTCYATAGVNCGAHRAPECKLCTFYDDDSKGGNYCNGDCTWHDHWWGGHCGLG